MIHYRYYVIPIFTAQGWGGILYPSPYATADRKRRQEGAPRDHIYLLCEVVLEDLPK